MSSENSDSSNQPTRPVPQEPENVDAILAESLQAQSEHDFAWKEPERKPRWWERQQELSAAHPAESSQRRTTARRPGSRTSARKPAKPVSAVFAVLCIVLALWVILSVVFGISFNPLVVGLVICSVAGFSLIIAGLRPEPGKRL